MVPVTLPRPACLPLPARTMTSDRATLWLLRCHLLPLWDGFRCTDGVGR
ncbi:unnamed protein product [Ixodes pacificus]